MRAPAEVAPFSAALERAGLDSTIECMHIGERLAEPGDPVRITVEKDESVIYEQICVGEQLAGIMAYLTTLINGGLLK